MQLETFTYFPDFELLDSGEGYRLERWGRYVLARPDPQAIWQRHLPEGDWKKVDAVFDEKWKIRTNIEQPWTITFPLPLRGETHTGSWDVKLNARLTPFKHTGIFAEQASNWEWLVAQLSSPSPFKGGVRRGISPKIKDSPQLKAMADRQRLRILNLFGYTGNATMVLAKLDCFVTHVDASKPAIAWAKENQAVNNLPDNSIRWILDDAAKFVKRELKRGQKYDGILLDPPAFGHSPSGRTWKFAEDFPKLLTDCVQLLSAEAKFLLINAYATNSSALALKNILEDAMQGHGGKIEFGELCLKQKDNRLISTGIFARWSR